MVVCNNINKLEQPTRGYLISCDERSFGRLRFRSPSLLSNNMQSSSVPFGASAAVLKPSDPIPANTISVEGPNFDDELNLQELLSSYGRIGFQATSFGRAIDIVNKMVSINFVFYSDL